ncbi:MAG: glutathione S-transferase, partial [Rhizobiales bacterium]|nr:glutathione S-transferase [Hyphomicrobiales bacterium]
MITVWGRASSSNVQKVTWTLDELGVEYERIDRGREFGGLDTPEYLANNPNGRVPTIQD